MLSRCQFATLDNHFDAQLTDWSVKHQPTLPPAGKLANKQSSWDKHTVEATYATLLAAQPDNYNKARLLAASATHSGDWLNALPITSCGLRLDDEAVRVAIGLRLGANLCEPHQCPCGNYVDCRGSHGLSCKSNSSKIVRHNFINDLVYRALVRAGIPSAKEPAGISRTDGKRPDGMTLIPWAGGKNVLWDITVIDTLAASYLPSTSTAAGNAAEIATARKDEKYAALSTNYNFVPIAIETLGPISVRATAFLRELGRRLYLATDDPRESTFLFQRLSVAVQRFNSVCFRGSFAKAQEDMD